MAAETNTYGNDDLDDSRDQQQGIPGFRSHHMNKSKVINQFDGQN